MALNAGIVHNKIPHIAGVIDHTNNLVYQKGALINDVPHFFQTFFLFKKATINLNSILNFSRKQQKRETSMFPSFVY